MALFNSRIDEGLIFGDKVREAAEGPMRSFMSGAKLGIEKGQLDVSRLNAQTALENAQLAKGRLALDERQFGLDEQKLPYELAGTHAKAERDRAEAAKLDREGKSSLYDVWAATGDLKSMNQLAAFEGNVVQPRMDPNGGVPYFELSKADTGEVLRKIYPSEKVAIEKIKEAGADRRNKSNAQDIEVMSPDGSIRKSATFDPRSKKRFFFDGTEVPHDWLTDRTQKVETKSAEEAIKYSFGRLETATTQADAAKEVRANIVNFQQLAEKSDLYGPGGSFTQWAKELFGGLGMDVGTEPLTKEAAQGLANRVVSGRLRLAVGGNPTEGERKFVSMSLVSMDQSPFARKLLADYLLLDAELAEQKQIAMLNHMVNNGANLLAGDETFDVMWNKKERQIRDDFATEATKLVNAKPKNMLERDLVNALIKRPGSREDILKGYEAAGHTLPDWAK